MENECDAKRDGMPVQFHNHVHLQNQPPAPPPAREVLAEAMRATMAAAEEDDWPPRFRRRRPRERGRWMRRLIFAAALAWEALGLLVLGLLNVLVLSKGLVELSPTLFGMRMSAMPGFAFMGWFMIWNKILVGHVIALGFFAVMALTWKIVIKDLVLIRGNDLIDNRQWNIKNSRLFWRIAGGVLMGCDALLFYYGVTQSPVWGRSTPYFSALVSTVMYLAIVAVYSFGCLYLWDWERAE